MDYIRCLFCKECGREDPAEPLNVCDFCFGPLEVTYDYDAIAREISRDKISQGPHSMRNWAIISLPGRQASSSYHLCVRAARSNFKAGQRF